MVPICWGKIIPTYLPTYLTTYFFIITYLSTSAPNLAMFYSAMPPIGQGENEKFCSIDPRKPK